MGQDLLHVIGLKDDVDISVAGTRFVECVKEYINHVQQNPSEESVEKEVRDLTALYKNFFLYSHVWAKRARNAHPNPENHPAAGKLKHKGSTVVDDLQANIIDFATCYTSLGRSLGLINAEMKRAPLTQDKDVQWSSETGTLLGKHRKKRAQLVERNKKLHEAIKLLEGIVSKRTAIENAAADLFGKDQAEKHLSSFRSGLRIADFNRARGGLSKLKNEKTKFAFDKKKAEKAHEIIKSEGESYIAFVEKHKDMLISSGEKLFLKPTEISIAIETNKKEIEQSETFIRKYFRPFLNHQIRGLKHLRTKLLVAGSLDSLMTLYIRMMRGIAEPLEDIKAVRLYEAEVIEHVMYLLSGQFQEMKNIEKRIEEALRDFSTSVHDYKDAKGTY